MRQLRRDRPSGNIMLSQDCYHEVSSDKMEAAAVIVDPLPNLDLQDLPVIMSASEAVEAVAEDTSPWLGAVAASLASDQDLSNLLSDFPSCFNDDDNGVLLDLDTVETAAACANVSDDPDPDPDPEAILEEECRRLENEAAKFTTDNETTIVSDAAKNTCIANDSEKCTATELLLPLNSISSSELISAKVKRDPTTKLFLCPQCPKTFQYSSRLQRHLTTHQVDLEKTFQVMKS